MTGYADRGVVWTMTDPKAQASRLLTYSEPVSMNTVEEAIYSMVGVGTQRA